MVARRHERHHRVGRGPRVYRSPVVSGAPVYVTIEHEDRPGGELRALTRDTGEERWRVASSPESRLGESSQDAPEPVSPPSRR